MNWIAYDYFAVYVDIPRSVFLLLFPQKRVNIKLDTKISQAHNMGGAYMMKKRLSALLLAACLTLTLLPAHALATSSRPSIIIPTSSQPYYGAPPFRPAPGTEQNHTSVSYTDLINLVWFSLAIQEELVLPYTDVPEEGWFYPGVRYVYQQALMPGVSETSFAPYEPVTRGLAWNVLTRTSGGDTTPASGEVWYALGMAWVVENGISDGTEPTKLITREQWVSMLWRRAGYPSAPVNLNAYADGDQVSGYAQDAMRWAISIGLIQGSNGKLCPQSTLNRAELATMVMRLAPKR